MIDVKHLFDTVGATKELNYEFDYSDYEFESTKPFTTPVKVVGEISNRAGVTSARFSVDFTAVFQCDRCLSEFEQDFSLNGNYVLTENDSDDLDEEKYILCTNGEFNLEEAVLFMILLNMPSKHLCNENCKGLCFKCGQNLNDGDCKCGTQDNE